MCHWPLLVAVAMVAIRIMMVDSTAVDWATALGWPSVAVVVRYIRLDHSYHLVEPILLIAAAVPSIGMCR